MKRKHPFEPGDLVARNENWKFGVGAADPDSTFKEVTFRERGPFLVLASLSGDWAFHMKKSERHIILVSTGRGLLWSGSHEFVRVTKRDR